MEFAQPAVIIALLGVCLVALVMIYTARKEASDIRSQVQKRVREVERKENDLQKRQNRLEKRSERLLNLEKSLINREKDLENQEISWDSQKKLELERIAQLDQTRAAEQILNIARNEAEAKIEKIYRDALKSHRKVANEKAKEILIEAMQRLAVNVLETNTISKVYLPHPELRGRIIGKEGRNVRSFEAITGTDIIIEDDTSHILLSSFDSKRRFIATRVLEQLINDGRITPGQIEKTYEQVRSTVDQEIREEVIDQIKDLQLGFIKDEILDVLCDLKFRTSYGQNALDHCVETAIIASEIAVQIGANSKVAKRASYFHDIGKVYTGSANSKKSGFEGTHASIGAHILKQAGEEDIVVNAVAAHHNEVEAKSLEAIIVQIADTISAARPGARKDTVERYVERMQDIEDLVDSFDGVERVLAMSSGHEVRVIVKPDAISDDKMQSLADSIAAKLHMELEYAGEIKITLVRELRVFAVAH